MVKHEAEWVRGFNAGGSGNPPNQGRTYILLRILIKMLIAVINTAKCVCHNIYAKTVCSFM